MFDFSQLKQIHLEISNNCQASCPWCLRNQSGGMMNPLIKVSNWTLDEFKNTITPEIISQLRYLNFLGNSGDAPMNNDLPEMCRYAKEINPNIRIKIQTNGGIRNVSWWRDIVECLPKNHLVIFGIDGLEDTNHIHRIGVKYEKAIENAKAFIDAGGKAQWSYIVFRHNEHQLEQARSLSKEMGFCHFEVKHSQRFFNGEDKDVLDLNGNKLYSISPPSANQVRFYTKKMVDELDLITEQSKEVKCFANHFKEIYIDVHKNVFPCSWLGLLPLVYDTGYTADAHKRMLNELQEVIKKIGNNNLMETSLEQILNSDAWQNEFDRAWERNGLIKCTITCGNARLLPKQTEEAVESFYNPFKD